MKKFICTLILFTIAITISLQSPLRKWMHPEKRVTKQINLEIPAENGYTSNVYAHNAAKLNITLVKLTGDNIDTLLTKEYPEFKLRNLHTFSKNFNHSIQVANVVDTKEQLVISYNVVYKTPKGSILTIKGFKWLPKGITQDKVLITI